MGTAHFSDITYSSLCTNIGKKGRKWQDKQKMLFLHGKKCSEYTIQSKKVIKTLTEDALSSCLQIKNFSSRIKVNLILNSLKYSNSFLYTILLFCVQKCLQLTMRLLENVSKANLVYWLQTWMSSQGKSHLLFVSWIQNLPSRQLTSERGRWSASRTEIGGGENKHNLWQANLN